MTAADFEKRIKAFFKEADRQHGEVARTVVARTMPVVFLQTLTEDAGRTIAIFDATHENPELIWNASMRSELRASLAVELPQRLRWRQRSPKRPGCRGRCWRGRRRGCRRRGRGGFRPWHDEGDRCTC